MPIYRRPPTFWLLSAVAALLSAGLSVGLSSPAVAAAPANDDFASAQVIADMGVPSQGIVGSNVGATKEPGEPNHAGNPGGSSIWYRWTAPVNSLVTTYSYLYSSIDSRYVSHELAVYTGSTVSSLTSVISQAARYPSFTFEAIAGTTYSIAIDRAAKSNPGSTTLYFYAVADNDDFANAQVISGTSGTVAGNNGNATSQPGEPDHAGQPGGQSVWYSWTAPENATIDFDTHNSDFDTLLGVYTGPAVNNLTEVASNDDCSASDTTSCVEFSAVSGTTYKIAVDGYDVAHGTIALNWAENLHCTITGTSGDDVLTGTSGHDVICGLGGDDTIDGEGGNDTIIGGDGTDTVDYSDATSGVVVDLRSGVATGQGTDTLIGIESVTGSANDDQIDGDDGPNVINGGAGDDAVYGHGGDDQVLGGSGDDTLGTGDGDDIANGGAGNDTIIFGQSTGPVSVNLQAGTVTGASGSDSIAAIENVSGSKYGDTLRGSAGINLIQGGAGNDTLTGLAGNDQLYGDAGSDSMNGGIGVDLCNGGAGTDTATACETVSSVP